MAMIGASPAREPADSADGVALTTRLAAGFRREVSDALASSATPLWIAYAAIGLLVAAYVVSVAARDGSANDRVLDGWALDVLELLMSLLCLARATIRASGRGVALALGAGLLSWSLGDTLVTVHSATVTPVTAGICYLLFYPLAYVAVVTLMRQEVRRLAAPTWLDGAVAGLGAAAVCAAFAFHTILGSAGGRPFTDAMNVAYPIGDVLLLGLVVGATAMLGDKKRTKWLLVAVACSINAVGDTFNLLHRSVGASPVGEAMNAVAWPMAILLMSTAVWLRPEITDRVVRDKPTGFVLPGLAATAGLVILVVGTVHPVGRIALGLAAATLVVAGARLALSVGALQAITEQRHRQSMTDELTGLGNRRYLSQMFESFFPMDPQADLSVEPRFSFLFVDLDRFKEVNDSFGHAAGDELLRQIGPRLESALRRADLLVRLGGDEFAVMLPETDAEQAAIVADRIAASLEDPFHLDVLPITISASIGIAVAPLDGTELAELIRCADAAMYRAKLSRVPFQVYDRTLDDGGDLLRLMEELRAAVEGDDLVLHFQAQLDLRTGTIPAVEALLRWEHPRLGTIPPLKFLPLAEEAGLMPALTARVLNDAIGQCAVWRAEGHEVAVSVNISATNLLDAGFVGCVAATLERHAVPPQALVLEITETCIISDYEGSRQVIDHLTRLGIVMSIDDFGAGFTSLAHLANLAVGELKLDRTFITGLVDRDGNRDVELVRSTIGLGHALGLRVVAEGIEDHETLQLLADFGCDLAQGYLISRPVPASAVTLGTVPLARA